MRVESFSSVVREIRRSAGLSQRQLARLAGTSQPAVARYERDVATPSWETLRRLATACGKRVTVNVEPVPDPGDLALAELLLRLTPEERLRTLARFARLHEIAQLGQA